MSQYNKVKGIFFFKRTTFVYVLSSDWLNYWFDTLSSDFIIFTFSFSSVFLICNRSHILDKNHLVDALLYNNDFFCSPGFGFELPPLKFYIINILVACPAP